MNNPNLLTIADNNLGVYIWAKSSDEYAHIQDDSDRDNRYKVFCGKYNAMLGNNYAVTCRYFCPECLAKYEAAQAELQIGNIVSGLKNTMRHMEEDTDTEFYYDKESRQLSFIDFPKTAEKHPLTNLGPILDALVREELKKSPTLYVYHCPDNALIQFEDRPTDEDTESLYYEEPIEPIRGPYRLFIAKD